MLLIVLYVFYDIMLYICHCMTLRFFVHIPDSSPISKFRYRFWPFNIFSILSSLPQYCSVLLHCAGVTSLKFACHIRPSMLFPLESAIPFMFSAFCLLCLNIGQCCCLYFSLDTKRFFSFSVTVEIWKISRSFSAEGRMFTAQ